MTKRYCVAGPMADVNGRVIHQLWALAGEAYVGRREMAFEEGVEAVTIAGLRAETSGLKRVVVTRSSRL